MTTPPERIEEFFTEQDEHGYSVDTAASGGDLNNKEYVRDYLTPKLHKLLHQELQQAHHNWLREEIVKLEGVKMANEHSSECLHNEAPEYCDCDNYIKWNKALQTIIDRYQSELDQPK